MKNHVVSAVIWHSDQRASRSQADICPPVCRSSPHRVRKTLRVNSATVRVDECIVPIHHSLQARRATFNCARNAYVPTQVTAAVLGPSTYAACRDRL